jgi:hypothetical protein
MTTEAAAGSAATETTTTAAVEAALSSQERDFEAEAREQGWVPEAEFKGDKKPRKFLSAEEFVERGEWANSIREKVESKFEDRLKKMERVHGKTVEQLEKEISDLRAERREAIKEGNVDKVEQIDEKIDGLKDRTVDTSKTKSFDDYDDNFQPKTDSPEHISMQLAFVKANAWMIDEPDMAEYAEKWSMRNAAANPDIGFKANMKATEAAVRRKFPDYFKDGTAANAHAAVDTGGQNGAGPLRSSKGLDSLPNEARQQAKADMAKFPKIYPNAEAWLKAYNG